MSALSSFFVWANLPYAIAFSIAVLFALLQMTGVLGLLVGDSDHDADHDVDHDVDHDTDHDVDHDADHDGHDDHGGLGEKVLVDLGVGRVPFSIVWQAFAITFGIAGLAINSLFLGRDGTAAAPATLAFTLPISLFIAYLLTRTTTRVLSRVLAGEHEEATSRKDLVGSSGVVISTQITNEFGEIRVADSGGRRMHLVCRIREGEKPIPSGQEVVIVDYDSKSGHIFVSPLDVDLTEEKPHRIGSNERTPENVPEDTEPQAENDDSSSAQKRRN